jgi:hypothetical protein
MRAFSSDSINAGFRIISPYLHLHDTVLQPMMEQGLRIVDGKIILEIKAMAALIVERQAQALRYQTANELRLALLLNFGARSPQFKRIICWALRICVIRGVFVFSPIVAPKAVASYWVPLLIAPSIKSWSSMPPNPCYNAPLMGGRS